MFKIFDNFDEFVWVPEESDGHDFSIIDPLKYMRNCAKCGIEVTIERIANLEYLVYSDALTCDEYKLSKIIK